METPPPLPPEELEASHAWFRARRDCILRIVQGSETPADAPILDLGCSRGFLLKSFADVGFTNLHGADPRESAVLSCQARGLQHVQQADLTAPPAPQRTFAWVIASEVLQSLEYPGVALENWRRLLQPDGKLLLFVPAFQFLWSGRDHIAGNLRRYTRGQLIEELRIAEFSIVTAGYWNSFAFPAFAAMRLGDHFRKSPVPPAQSHLKPLKPFWNDKLHRLLKTENALLHRGFRAPIGLTAWAIAQPQEIQ